MARCSTTLQPKKAKASYSQESLCKSPLQISGGKSIVSLVQLSETIPWIVNVPKKKVASYGWCGIEQRLSIPREPKFLEIQFIFLARYVALGKMRTMCTASTYASKPS